jgi:hypothetical protein
MRLQDLADLMILNILKSIQANLKHKQCSTNSPSHFLLKMRVSESGQKMEHQDWSQVVLRSTTRTAAAAAATVPTKRTASAIAAAKIDKTDDIVKPKYFSRESVLAIQEYRRDQNLTQRGLDGRIGFPAGTMNHLEGRTAAPTSTQLQTLNNMLKKALTRE